MNPNEREKIFETYELVKENNKILKSLRRTNRLSFIFRSIYWLLIIGVSIGAFYFIQPYIDVINKTYGGIQSNITDIKSMTNNLKDVLKN